VRCKRDHQRVSIDRRTNTTALEHHSVASPEVYVLSAISVAFFHFALIFLHKTLKLRHDTTHAHTKADDFTRAFSQTEKREQ